jgi:Na+-translocating ferredoxin:NAD+ oxidoreductase RnfD subunit
MFEELTPVPADLLLTVAVADYFVDVSSALRGIRVITVAVALSNLPLPVMQEEFRLILPRSCSALVFGLLLGVV